MAIVVVSKSSGLVNPKTGERQKSSMKLPLEVRLNFGSFQLASLHPNPNRIVKSDCLSV